MTKKTTVKFELIENNGQCITCVACGRMPRHQPIVAIHRETPKSEPIFLCEDCLGEDDLDKTLEATVSHHEQEVAYCEDGAKHHSARAKKFKASAKRADALRGKIVAPSRDEWAALCSAYYMKHSDQFTWISPKEAKDLSDDIPF